jgi:nitrous oxidase accessory protein
MLLRFVLVVSLLGLALGETHPGRAAGGQEWLVSPAGPITTIEQALAQAGNGDTIRVRGGVYPGPLVVNKSVRLVGEDWPVVDSGGQGTVVALTAPGIAFSGFTLRGSGYEPDRDHAGIILQAADILVEGNHLEDVLFGIFVAQADGAVLRGNQITSKAEYQIARKGDAIRVWYSQNVTVEDNLVYDARDVVAWYSNNLVFRDNTIRGGRYGVHLMYCDQAEVVANQLRDNSVGVYVMYSQGVLLSQNDIRGQRGPSGYALGFKDSDNVLAENNLLVDNRAGAFLDNAPFSPGSYARFEDNIFAFNDIGVILLSFVKGAQFTGNTFWENIEQVALQGSGKAGANLWQGNFWSDYAGFDATGDSQGDLPYRSERFFEGLTSQEPTLRALLYSPAAQALELAAASFPVIRPQPKLEDPAPRLTPGDIPAEALTPAGASGLPLTGLALALIAALLVGLGLRGENSMTVIQQSPPAAPRAAGDSPLVQLSGLTKAYGKAVVLRQVSLEIQAGQSVALWGANGAGKTTLLKSVLGLIDYQGQITIAGWDVRRQGKQARALVGYVPQEAAFYDMSVLATMRFYAGLKKVPAGRIAPLLEQLGLEAHLHKAVPALSGGLKQRLALAVALLSNPPLLLLDEPTASLDAAARKDYLGLLNSLRRAGKTLIFASHRIEEVESLADRVIVMEAGQITHQWQPQEVRQQLAPQVALTLWVPEGQRQQALASLAQRGWLAHLNGRGTVVVELRAGAKLQALEALLAEGIVITDFEIERVHTPWN